MRKLTVLAAALLVVLPGGSVVGQTAMVPVAARSNTAFVPLPPLTGTVRIMIAGDSIAAGMGIVCPDGSSYGDRKPFGDWLAKNAEVSFVLVGSQAATCNFPYQRHEGHGGFTIGQLADNIGAYLQANMADILILRVGVNDAKASGGYHSAAQMAADYTRLIDNARAANPAIRILAGQVILPNGSVSQEFAIASKTATEFNLLLPTIVAPYGDAVHIGRNNLIPSLRLSDGLHPSGAGYLMLACITVQQPDGIWPWLSTRPPANTDCGDTLTTLFPRG